MTIYDIKPTNDNDAEEQNRRYYENRHHQKKECEAMAITICAFALFCMIIGAVVMKIAMGG